MAIDRLGNGLRLVYRCAERREEIERVYRAPELEGETCTGKVARFGPDVVQHAGKEEGLDKRRLGLEGVGDIVVEEGEA